MEAAYEAAGKSLRFCLLLSLLEIVNSVLGLVKGGVLATCAQVTLNCFAPRRDMLCSLLLSPGGRSSVCPVFLPCSSRTGA